MFIFVQNRTIMSKKLLSIFLFISPLLVLAQSQEKSYFSVTVGAGVVGATTTTNSTQQAVYLLNQNYTQYNDSVQKFQTTRFNFAATLWYNYVVNDQLTLQAGLGYIDMGYRREQNDLKLGDHTYPGIGFGKIVENTNATRNIYYDYKFHYLQIPLWANYALFKSKDFKTTVSVTGGLSANVLLKHQLVAKLDNFKMDDKDKFTFDSTGYSARSFGMQVNLGLKVEHKLEKDITLIFQPMYNYHPFSATNEPISVGLYGFLLNAGVVIDLDILDE